VPTFPAGDQCDILPTPVKRGAADDSRMSLVPTSEASNVDDRQSLLPLPSSEEEKKGEKKRIKKRKLEQADSTIEFSKEVITQQLKDTSDIVMQRRPTAPIFKRARYEPVDTAITSAAVSLPLSAELTALLRRTLVRGAPADIPRRPGAPAAAADAEIKDDRSIDEHFREQKDDMKEDVGMYMGDMGYDLDIVPAPGAELEPGVELPPEPLPDEGEEEQQLLGAAAPEVDTSAFETADQQEHQAAEEKEKQGLGPTFADDEEEAEEKRSGWSKRTLKMYQLLKQHMKHVDSFSYESLLKGNNRAVAAGILYELWVLATDDRIAVKQPAPYKDIVITKARFNRPVPTVDAA